MKHRNSGFTLIELITVIVLLGILSVVALPRFMDLKQGTQSAVLKNIAGVLQSAHDSLYLAAIVQGKESELNGGTQFNGISVHTHYGHARSHWTTTWQHIVDIDVEAFEGVSKTFQCSTDRDYCVFYTIKHGTPGYTNDWTIYILPNLYAINA